MALMTDQSSSAASSSTSAEIYRDILDWSRRLIAPAIAQCLRTRSAAANFLMTSCGGLPSPAGTNSAKAATLPFAVHPSRAVAPAGPKAAPGLQTSGPACAPSSR
jgi:hypothetical protein